MTSVSLMTLVTLLWKLLYTLNQAYCYLYHFSYFLAHVYKVFLPFNMSCTSLLGVCKMYEEHLKRMNPNSPSITYDISQLFDFIDDLADLSCLV